MGDIVKFRTARKTIVRQRNQQLAAANRIAHGRSKAERTLDNARNAKADRDLDQHRVKTGDDR
jgi:hypothetical protein